MKAEEPAVADPLGALITSETESKKENCQDHSPRSEVNSATNETVVRKTTPSYSASGAKRQRIVTPITTKVIDVEDEPKSSPLPRKISCGTVQDGNNKGEKKVLGEIENIR